MGEPDAYEAEHFRKFTPQEGGILEELEKEAAERDIPIVGPYVGKILWTMVKLMDAKRVLELGTATGYSAIWMAKALSETGGELLSVEWEKEMVERARKNIERAGLSCSVKVVAGDAKEVLTTFESNHFDMVFQDVDKELYLEQLEECVRVLRTGGLLICDNTSFKTAGEFLEKSVDHPDLDGFHIHAFLPGHGPEYDALTFLIKK